LWGECDGLLKQGTNNWSVRAVDYAGNEREQARIVYYGISPTPTPSLTLTPRQKISVKEPSLETEIIKEEKIPAETEEEKEKLKLRGPTVQITVLDEKGRPARGAKVTLYSEPRVAYTDEQGVAVFTSVEKGEHRVLIAYQGKEGEQQINLEGEEIKEFHYTIQVKPSSSLFSAPVVFIVGVLVTLLGVLVAYLIYKKRSLTQADK
jgi:transketolase